MDNGRVELVELDVNGNTLAQARAPAVFGWFRWLSGLQFVLNDGGRIFVFDASTGDIRVYATGEVADVQKGRIVWRSCDAQIRCTLNVGSNTNPTWRNLGAVAALDDGAIAPDGNLVILHDRTQLTLHDMRSGVERPLRGPHFVTWTPDSRFVITRDSLGRYSAHDVASDRVFEFDIPVNAERLIAV